MKTKIVGVLYLLGLVAVLGLLMACAEAHPSYQVVALNVSPNNVSTGEKVLIKAEVKNVNSETDTFNVPLMVDGVADNRKSITLAPGQTELLTFELTKSKPGTYKISVGGRESTLTVHKPSPPDFRLSNLQILPAEVDVCESVVVTAKLTNAGGNQGSYTVELKIDGITNQAEKLTVSPGQICALCFKVSKGLPGTYQVTLGNLTGEFKVKDPPSPVFDIPVAPPCPPENSGPCDWGG